ncbi:nitroreductase family protein [Pseudolysinimonas yzui]|uniref:nitroreductase family protein n=1 Tax=Pseudolysinimonas yzui TaxID=2708254 RepID=UPI001E5307D2|nr:nitroreductase family protein [Pseudolysinimonas yzui]
MIETILRRRSIRGPYHDRPVPRGHVELVLASGLAAPSSKNAQPWRFHVLETVGLRTRIADAVDRSSGIEEYVPHDPRTGNPSPHWSSTVLESSAVLRTAAVAIAIENRGVFSGGRATLYAASHEALIGNLTAYGFETMGLGTALENMWLAANSLGIDAAFLGDLVIAEGEARTLLGIEGDLMGVLAMGYSLEGPAPKQAPPPVTQTDSPVVWH